MVHKSAVINFHSCCWRRLASRSSSNATAISHHTQCSPVEHHVSHKAHIKHKSASAILFLHLLVFFIIYTTPIFVFSFLSFFTECVDHHTFLRRDVLCCQLECHRSNIHMVIRIQACAALFLGGRYGIVRLLPFVCKNHQTSKLQFKS